MQVTLIGGTVIDASGIIFNIAALNNGTSPVFEQSSSGASLDNYLKVADMDNLFSDAGWTYDKWNAWRAAHPISGTPVPFQNQDSIPGTSILGNLADQNWLDTAANYYLDTFDTPAKKVGSALIVVAVGYVIYKVATNK